MSTTASSSTSPARRRGRAIRIGTSSARLWCSAARRLRAPAGRHRPARPAALAVPFDPASGVPAGARPGARCAPCGSPPWPWCSRPSSGVLLAVGRLSDHRACGSLVTTVVEFFRAIPLLVVIFFAVLRAAQLRHPARAPTGRADHRADPLQRGRAGRDLPGRHPVGRPRAVRGGVRARPAQVAGHDAGAAAPGGPADAAGDRQPAGRAAQGHLARASSSGTSSCSGRRAAWWSSSPRASATSTRSSCTWRPG